MTIALVMPDAVNIWLGDQILHNFTTTSSRVKPYLAWAEDSPYFKKQTPPG
jgi:hypothetical protein